MGNKRNKVLRLVSHVVSGGRLKISGDDGAILLSLSRSKKGEREERTKKKKARRVEEEKERKMRTHKCGRKKKSKDDAKSVKNKRKRKIRRTPRKYSFHDHGICALTMSNDRQHFDVYLMLQHPFRVLKHIDPRLHHAHETAAIHTRLHRRHRSNFQLCVVHSWVNSQCIPNSFHEHFIAQKNSAKIAQLFSIRNVP